MKFSLSLGGAASLIPGLFKPIPFDKYEIQTSKAEHILREIGLEITQTQRNPVL